MPRNTLVWLPLQSRRALVHRHPIMFLFVVVLHVSAMSPTCHCKNKQTGALDDFYPAGLLRCIDAHGAGEQAVCDAEWEPPNAGWQEKRCWPEPEERVRSGQVGIAMFATWSWSDMTSGSNPKVPCLEANRSSWFYVCLLVCLFLGYLMTLVLSFTCFSQHPNLVQVFVAPRFCVSQWCQRCTLQKNVDSSNWC